MSGNLPPLRLRLLAPSIALIIAATMIPTGLRHPSLIHVDNHLNPVDVINNIILYVPLGFALAESSVLRALLYGLVLSTVAETLQLGYVDRIPSFIDITANTLGAVLGFWVALCLQRISGYNLQRLRIPRALGLAAIPMAALGTLMLLVHRPPPDFSNWSPACHMMLGNEWTGDRPWAGTISALQIYPFAMQPAQIEDLARRAKSPLKGEPHTPPPFPSGGLLPPVNLATGTGRALLSSEQEQALLQSLVKQGRMSLLISITPGNVEQAGPARIVTYSQNAYSRNFSLGQIRDALTFRLRTPISGSNGTDPALYTGPVLLPHHTSFVAAVYDGRISSLYVDGKPAAHLDLGFRRPHLPKRVLARLPGSIPIRVLELGAVEMLCSSLLALGLIALCGIPQSFASRILTGLVAGLAVGATVWFFAVSSRGLGMRILLECLVSGLMIAASVEQT